jgi:hypothetical protein
VERSVICATFLMQLGGIDSTSELVGHTASGSRRLGLWVIGSATNNNPSFRAAETHRQGNLAERPCPAPNRQLSPCFSEAATECLRRESCSNP